MSEEWTYSLRQSDDEDELIELFDNAGQIIIRRFVFNGDDLLEERIFISGGLLYDLIHKYFTYKKNEIEKVLKDG